jgi:hypothetical protein
MSMSEPFMPAQEPAASSKPSDRDLDADTDVFIESGVDDPDAQEAAARQRARVEDAPFRTPVAGARLTEDELEQDLGDS